MSGYYGKLGMEVSARLFVFVFSLRSGMKSRDLYAWCYFHLRFLDRN